MSGFRKTLLLPLMLLLVAAGRVSGQLDNFQLKRHLVQATTHPDIDLSPRVSPDGKWMVYVNRNAGNFDIWLQSTAGGRAIQLTKHKADDFYPVWGPNSRWIVFVSQRSDAAGDIWRINLRPVKQFLIPKGKPQQITFYQGMDNYPTISPDGKKIAWTSDRTGREEIWFFNYNTDKTTQLTFMGGTQPCWSTNQELIAFTSFRAGPESNGDIWLINLHGRKPESPEETKYWDSRELPTWQVTRGPALDGFPAWSKEARSIVFERHDFDSDGDGRITPDDNGMLWSVTVRDEPDYNAEADPVMRQLTGDSFVPAMSEKIMPITSGAEYTAQPSFGGNGRLYFVADRQGNLDAWSASETGYIPAFNDADSQYAFAQENFALPERMLIEETGPLLYDFDSSTLSYNDRLYLGDRIIALHRVFDLFPNRPQVTATALYEIGFGYGLLGYPQKAATYFQLILDQFADDSLRCAFADMALLGLQTREQYQQGELATITDELQKIANRYSGVERAFVPASIYLADLYARSGEISQAEAIFQGIISDYPEYEEAAAECYYKLGRLYERADPQKALGYYLQLFESYDSYRRWILAARDRILNRELNNKSLDQQRQVCLDMSERYKTIPQIVVAARLRLAAVLEELDDLEAAFRIFDALEKEYQDMAADVFRARLGKGKNLFKRGREQEAFDYYQELLALYQNHKVYYQQTLDSYLSALLQSADALKDLGRFAQARNRYKKAIDLAPAKVEAHKGYVECFYRLGEIDDAIAEYEAKDPYKLRDNVLIYSLGLAYSYKGTDKAERTGNPEYIDVDLLHNSSRIVAIALSYDYSFVEAYLTIAFNYELTENYYDHQRAKPVPYYRRAFNMLVAPIQSIYRTITFYNETKTPRYYERAIHELTKAITLNDERTNPKLEAALALNLANNYYSLGEFGFAKAFENYRIKLKYDSTFTGNWQKAKFFERLGHCSLYVEAIDEGSEYLNMAISLYNQLGHNDKVIINTKRLALLEEIAGEHDEAVTVYQKAASLEEQSERLTGLMRSYRSMAFNYLQAGQPRQAILFAQKSLELIESGRIPVIKDERHRVKFGFLGWYLPIPFVNLAALGASSGTVLTTDQERAFAYTILAEAYAREKDYDHAIDFFLQKTEIYRARDDYVAVASFLNNIGYLCFQKGDLAGARDYFTQSIELSEKKKINRGIFENSLNLARLYIALSAEASGSPQGMRELQEFADYAADKLNLTLRLTDEEEAYHGELRSRVYLLLAQMSFLEAELPPEIDFVQHIRQSLGQLEKLNNARIYIEEALRISSEQQLPLNQCQAHLAMGALFGYLGDKVAAYPHLVRARELAIRNGYLEYIWKSNASLGNLLSQLGRDEKITLGVQKAPFEYYAEAIDVLEANVGSGIVATQGGQWQAFQAPYRQAIGYLAEKGDWYGALLFAEHMRSFFLISLLNDENVVLADSVQQRLYKSARALQKQISTNRIELLKVSTRIDVSPAQRAQLRQQAEELQYRWRSTLAEMDGINPQMKSLVQPSHVPLDDVRSLLEPGDALFSFVVYSGKLFVWAITSDNIRFQSFEFEGTVSEDANVVKPDFNMLAARYHLDDLLQAMPNINRITVVPDFADIGLPWFEMFGAAVPKTRALNVAVTTSLGSFFAAAQKSRSDGQEIFLADAGNLQAPLAGAGYSVTTPTATSVANSFSGQLSSLRIADFLHLNLTAKWNDHSPARTLLGFPIPRSTSAVFSPLDLYSLNLRPTAVTLELERSWPAPSVSLAALVNALNFAGAPAVLVAGGSVNNELANDFYSEFYRLARTLSPGRAFVKAKQLLLTCGVSAEELSRFQLFGYNGEPGAGKGEHKAQSPEELVAASERLLNIGKIDAAMESFWQAADIEKSQDRKAGILRKILQTAVNQQLWSHAVRAQHRLNAIHRRAREQAAVAEGFYALSLFFEQDAHGDSARYYLNRARQYCTQYGLAKVEPSTWLHLAESISSPGSADLGLQLIERAVVGFGREDNPNLALCEKVRGKIYLRQLRNPSQAVASLYRAFDFFQKKGPDEQTVQTAILYAAAWRLLGDYAEAVSILKQAHRSAEEMPERPLKARLYYALAQSLNAGGFYNEALKNLESAINIYEKQGAGSGLVRCYNLKGTVEAVLGRPEAAAQDQLLALRLAKDAEVERIVPAIYRAMGNLERQNGDMEKAVLNFRNAIERDSLNYNFSGLVDDLVALSATYLDFGKRKEALQTLERIPAGSVYQPTYAEATQLELLKARALLEAGNPVEANRIAGECLERSLSCYDFSGAASAYYWLGRFIQENDPDSAMTNYQRAADLLLDESLLNSSLLFFNAEELFERMIDLAVRHQENEQALIYAEMSRFYQQYISLQNGLVDFAGLDSVTTRSLKAARKQFLLGRDTIQRYKVRTKKSDPKVLAPANKAKEAFENFVRAREQFRRANAHHETWLTFPDSLIAKVTKALPENGAALVYHLADEQLYSWVLTRETLHFNRMEINRQQVESNIVAFNDSARAGGQLAEGDELYQLLLEPLTGYLAGKSQIYIVPHGALVNMLFAAIPYQSDNYFGLKFALSKSPGLYSLPLLGRKERSNAISQVSVFDMLPRPLDAEERFLHRREITMAQRYFKELRIYRGQRATREQFENTNEQGIIFFRGKMTEKNREPESSFLSFWPDSNESDRMTARDFYSTSINSQVAVLKVQIVRERKNSWDAGLLSFSNGLFFSGVGSILWNEKGANSFDSLLLLKRFFYNLSEGYLPGQSLHMARLYYYNNHSQQPGPWLCWELWGSL